MPYPISPSTCKCIKMQAIKRAPIVATVLGKVIAKVSEVITEHIKANIRH